MNEKIKLENIHSVGYDKDTGEPVVTITEEFVCAGCRHLVSLADRFCWYCGIELQLSHSSIEHYSGDEKLNDSDFDEIKQFSSNKRAMKNKLDAKIKEIKTAREVNEKKKQIANTKWLSTDSRMELGHEIAGRISKEKK